MPPRKWLFKTQKTQPSKIYQKLPTTTQYLVKDAMRKFPQRFCEATDVLDQPETWDAKTEIP
jgi:hypothetical protein